MGGAAAVLFSKGMRSAAVAASGSRALANREGGEGASKPLSRVV